MTIQTVSLAADLVLLLTGAAVVALFAGTVVQLARRRRRSAAVLACSLGVLVVVYGGALLAGGLLSGGPRQLGPGDAKCFDDWCAAMLRTHEDTGALLVDVQLQNRGRGRAMRADLARAYLEVGGREVAPRDGSALQTLVEPGQRVDVELAFPVSGSRDGVRFVVVEGAGGFGPGTFEIGGEGSPFHSIAGWPL